MLHPRGSIGSTGSIGSECGTRAGLLGRFSIGSIGSECGTRAGLLGRLGLLSLNAAPARVYWVDWVDWVY
eukprot:1190754-Prorocentrum_minimum.AAC.2